MRVYSSELTTGPDEIIFEKPMKIRKLVFEKSKACRAYTNTNGGFCYTLSEDAGAAVESGMPVFFKKTASLLVADLGCEVFTEDESGNLVEGSRNLITVTGFDQFGNQDISIQGVGLTTSEFDEYLSECYPNFTPNDYWDPVHLPCNEHEFDKEIEECKEWKDSKREVNIPRNPFSSTSKF